MPSEFERCIKRYTFILRGFMMTIKEIIKDKKRFKQHILEGKTSYELAELYGCSKSSIHEAKKRLGYLTKNLRPHDKTNRKALGITNCEICDKKSSMKTCSKCANKIIKIAKKKILIEQLGNRCEKCGYNKCQSALDFHHLDPAIKEYAIGEINTNFEKLLQEIKKCKLLCNRCHRELHYELSDSDKFTKKSEVKINRTMKSLKNKYGVGK